MEMLCPECRGPLVSSDGQTATCRIHGGTYHILFSRYPLLAPPPPPVIQADGGVGLAPIATATAQAIPGVFCTQHPDVPAVIRCHSCHAPSCATCDFAYPGDIHLCPSCASNPRRQMSPRRKKLIPWSIGLAVFSMIGFVAMIVVSATNRNKVDAEVIGALGGWFSLLPALIGLALGVASREKRLATSGVVWIGIVGNGLVLVVWFALMIVGIMNPRH